MIFDTLFDTLYLDADKHDFNVVYADLAHLEEEGHWENNKIPEWAKAKAKEFGTYEASASVLLWAFRFVAISAMHRLAEVRPQTPPGSKA